MTANDEAHDRDSERSKSVLERVGQGEQYGDPEDHRPAHVAPPDEDDE